MSARCRRRLKCTMDNCNARHYALLHNSRDTSNIIQKQDTTPVIAAVDERETYLTLPTIGKSVLLKVITGGLRVGQKEVVTSALLDSGSTVTLLRADLAGKLGASGPEKSVGIQWGDGNESLEENSQILNISARGTFSGSREFVLEGVKTVHRLPQYTQSVDRDFLQNKWPYLRGIPFAFYCNNQFGMLV